MQAWALAMAHSGRYSCQVLPHPRGNCVTNVLSPPISRKHVYASQRVSSTLAALTLFLVHHGRGPRVSLALATYQL